MKYGFTILDTAALATPAPDHFAEMHHKLAAETERWLRKAIEQGAGWNVWRSEMTANDCANPFVLTWRFGLVAPGTDPPGAGILFTQPELTEGERIRLLAGRSDWKEDRWQDYCGVPDCGHRPCEEYFH